MDLSGRSDQGAPAAHPTESVAMRLPRVLLGIAAAAIAILAVAGWILARILAAGAASGFNDARRELDLLPRPLPAVVLGMGGDSVLDRANLALRLWQNRSVALFVTAGGQGGDETEPEATTLAKALAAGGVPSGAVREEAASTSTWENLVNSKAILQGLGAFQGRVIIVTHDYHALRAGEIAAELGYDALVVTTDGPRLDRRARRLVREVGAYVRWRLRKATGA
jgi:uncharacterized SAM-binding protein YcdF (DUF218 family)